MACRSGHHLGQHLSGFCVPSHEDIYDRYRGSGRKKPDVYCVSVAPAMPTRMWWTQGCRSSSSPTTARPQAGIAQDIRFRMESQGVVLRASSGAEEATKMAMELVAQGKVPW